MVNYDRQGFKQLLSRVMQKLYLEIFAISAFSIAFYSCALYSPGSNGLPVVKTCAIPADQSATVSGHWTAKPVPIAFHQGDFTAAEMLAMTNAADSWNTFYTASEGYTVFDYGGNASSPKISSSPNVAQGGGLCGHGILQAGSFNGNVVIYKLGTWPYAASAMALTSFCTLSAKPFASIYMAVLEINYVNFFVEGTGKFPDLTSIILHELGHVLGLNHSCEGTAKAGTPNCNDTALPPDYSLASMFPSFGFDQTGAGQIKQSLGANDQSRANCLYEPSPTATTTPTH
jgi:hypothetical protein